MDRQLKLPLLYSLLVALTLSSGLCAQDSEQAWAKQQQLQLAEDLLRAERDEFYRFLTVAHALGPDRVIDEVRLALIERLHRVIESYEEAKRAGIPFNDVFNGETYLEFCDVVASMNDVRAISVLVKSGEFGSSPSVAEGLASFGERALPEIMEAVNDENTDDFAISTPLRALSILVEDGRASDLSTSALNQIREFARSGIHSGNDRFILTAIDVAVGLDDPELIREVEVLANDRGTLSERGFSDWRVDWIRRNAAEALAAPQQRQ